MYIKPAGAVNLLSHVHFPLFRPLVFPQLPSDLTYY